MRDRYARGRSAPGFAFAVTALALLLAGCGGRSGSAGPPPGLSFVPPGGVVPGETESPRGMQSIERSSAATVAAKVTRSVAHAMPVAGHPAFLLHGLVVPEATSSRDLRYYGGPVLSHAQSYNIYVNCASSCWGSPGTFLTRFGASTFVHILDQYTGATASNRYGYGGAFQVSYDTSGTLEDQDIENLIHSVVTQNGTSTGYASIYHVFLASGVKQCSASAGGCYATDYCAYHGSFDFSDIGHTLYSLEPYQNIAGCRVASSTPNGVLTDSTASTLSHETSEAITDPDVAIATSYAPPLAWYNVRFGEIGDICQTSVGTVTLAGVTYELQREYSNARHACSFS